MLELKSKNEISDAIQASDFEDSDAYENDPRFIEYISFLSEHSTHQENLVDSAQVFRKIRNNYGW